MIKISVVVPIYNTEEYLKECLDSIVNQSYTNIEIILVDDGSTDGSGKICDEYAINDSRITVLHKANGGHTSARKAGIMIATGDYVHCLDSDDWIELNTYEDIVKKLSNNRPDVITFGYIKEYGTFAETRFESLEEGTYYRKDVDRIIADAKQEIFYKRILVSSCCYCLVKKELLQEKIGIVSEKILIGEDALLIYSCIWHSNVLVAMHNAYYHYRIRNNSILHEVKNIDIEESKLLIKSLFFELKNSGLLSVRVYRSFLFFVYFCLLVSVPEYIFKQNKDILVLYPEIKRGHNIVIYGKGAYGDRLKAYIEKTGMVNVVAHVDKKTINEVSIEALMKCDYVVIAVTGAEAVIDILHFLEQKGVDKEKIQYIKNDVLTEDNLPQDLVELLK